MNRNAYSAALAAVLPSLVGAAFWVGLATHEAPMGDWVGDQTIAKANRASNPINVPAWNPALAVQFPGCTGSTDGLTDKVVVLLDGSAERVSFDEAVRMVETRSTNSIWVVGSC